MLSNLTAGHAAFADPESYCLLLLVFGQAVMQRDAVTAHSGKSVIPNFYPETLISLCSCNSWNQIELN